MAGQSIPYAGPARGKATVIFRASDIRLDEPAAAIPPGHVAIAGVLHESLFLGAHYRHYIRLGDTTIMADSSELHPRGPVRLLLASDRLQVYREPD